MSTYAGRARRWRRLGVLLSIAAAAFAVALGGAATPGGRASDNDPGKPDRKPAKPEKSQPSKKGLVTALGLDVDVSASAATQAVAGLSQGGGIPGAGASTLVLYDTTDAYGWLGELYAIATANLASHFGSWKAVPVSSYTSGDIGRYTATIYIGSTYDEPLPAAFLDDVWNATRPVIWIYDNIWELSNRYASTFQSRYGWSWSQFDTNTVSQVRYKGVTLTRDGAGNDAGIMAYSYLDPAKAQVLATAVRSDGTTFPWAVRSGMLTYVGENPYTYTSETDRLLAFEDMLFDALQPSAAVRHRALVRLEDISPATDPVTLKRIVDYLYGQRIPFGFGMIPVYTDPLAVENSRPTTIRLSASQQMADLVRYMEAHGGTLIEHGYTHQYSNVRNPYNGLTGDDYEFYRVTENADHTLAMTGPLPGDSTSWALSRIDAATQELATAGAGTPSIFEVPHYAATAPDYQAVAQRFGTRWERGLYVSGLLGSGTANYGRVIGQLFPYVVRDVFGTVVLPENIGDYEPVPFHIFPVHTVADILNAAQKNTVIRDGFAAFYYHPDNDVGPLQQIVEGLRTQGWTFTDPAALAGVPVSQPPVNTALPTISGTAQQGQTLTAGPGSWSGSPTSYAYQWQRCNSTGTGCTNLGGATTQAYQLASADVGSTMRVAVTATNSSGSTTATSAPTAVVTAPAAGGTFGTTGIGPSSDPILADRKRVNRYTLPVAGDVTKLTVYLQPGPVSGQQLFKGIIYGDQGGTATTLLGVTNQLTYSSAGGAGWYDLPFASPVSLPAGTYWIGVISGSTSYSAAFRWTSVSGSRAYNTNTYVSGPSNPFGTASFDSEQMSLYATYTASSGGSTPMNTALPTISGTAQQGQTLTAGPGSWSGSPTSYAYQWQRCNSTGTGCTNLGGATTQAYQLASADVGSTMRVAVTATNSSGSTTATSAPTAVVTAPAAGSAPVNTVLPTITGTPRTHATLTASTGTWAGAPAPTFAYQWLRCSSAGTGCVAIAGATATTYAPANRDVGFTLRVRVTATNPSGSAQATSLPTGVVTRR